VVREGGEDYDVHAAIQDIEREMLEAAEALEFERAAILRDELAELKRQTGGAGGGAGQGEPRPAVAKPTARKRRR